MSSRLRLGIDLDGVVADWSSEATATLNLKFGLKIDDHGGDVPSWDYLREQVTGKQWAWLWRDGVREGLFYRLQELTGVDLVLRRLSRDHDVYFLTNRPMGAARDTMEWLSSFSWTPRGLLFFKTDENKGNFECDVYVDDKPGNCVDIQEVRPDALVVMMTRRHNAEAAWYDRVDSLKEFEDIVRQRGHNYLKGAR